MARERKGSILNRNGRLFARVRFKDETGKQRDIWRKADNRTHARQLIRQMLLEIENATAKQLDSANMTFAQLADFYTKNYLHEAVYVGERKVAGVRGMQPALSQVKPLIAHFRNQKLRSISYNDIRSYKQMRLQTPTIHGQPRNIVSVNRELSKLRRMLNIAIQQGWLVKNPFRGGDPLICLADEIPRERVLTHEEEARLLEACGERPITYKRSGKLIMMRDKGESRPHLRALIIAALDTACRRGELLKLRWRDVDLENGLITIAARNSKTARKRLVALTPRFSTELASLWLKSSQDLDALVFGISNTIKNAFASVCRAANIPDLHFHDLRHSAITRMVAAGVAPVEIMKVSGHSQYATFARYVNPTEQSVKEAASALHAFNANASPPQIATEMVN